MTTLADLLGVKGTLVMSDEAARQYAFERKLADPNTQRELFDEQLNGLRGVIIENAKTEDEVRSNLIDAGFSPVEYHPPKSNEAHFYVRENGFIHAVNSRGITRMKRDEALAVILKYVLPQPIAVDVSNQGHNRRRANDRFELFAFNLVDDIFNHLNKDTVASNGRVNLVFGPYVSMDQVMKARDCEIVHETTNDYLNYRLVVMKTSPTLELVINFDYIFADQAKDVLHKLYKGIAAEFSGKSIDINLLHYGKVGVLDPATNVGDIIIPTGAIDDEKLQYAIKRGQPTPPHYPIKNQLVTNPEARRIFYSANEGRIHTGLTVNTTSVPHQTREGLQADLDAGGLSLDMEWIVMASLDAGSESTYPGLGTIRYFLAGIGSDKPLEGQNLGNTEYPRNIEQKVAASFLQLIRSFPVLYRR